MGYQFIMTRFGHDLKINNNHSGTLNLEVINLYMYSIRLSEDQVWIRAMYAVDRKSTRLNSSHSSISYAVFCLKKKKKHSEHEYEPDGRPLELRRGRRRSRYVRPARERRPRGQPHQAGRLRSSRCHDALHAALL